MSDITRIIPVDAYAVIDKKTKTIQLFFTYDSAEKSIYPAGADNYEIVKLEGEYYV